MIAVHRVKIDGAWWLIKFVPAVEIDGDQGRCIKDDRLILINEDLRGGTLLDVLLHECLHAAGDFLAEEWVTQTATDLTNVIGSLAGT